MTDLDDLTKIDVPFGELDEETRWLLKGAYADGRKVSFRWPHEDWLIPVCSGTAGDLAWDSEVHYRLAPPEPVKQTREWPMGVSAYLGSEPIISAGNRDTKGWHKGITTVHFVDKKPVRIVWEADQ